MCACGVYVVCVCACSVCLCVCVHVVCVCVHVGCVCVNEYQSLLHFHVQCSSISLCALQSWLSVIYYFGRWQNLERQGLVSEGEPRSPGL